MGLFLHKNQIPRNLELFSLGNGTLVALKGKHMTD